METTQNAISPAQGSLGQDAVQLSLFAGRRAAQYSTTAATAVKDFSVSCNSATKSSPNSAAKSVQEMCFEHQLKGVPFDRNMQVAFQLAKTLKGRGPHRRTYAKLSADQKHQFGNAICEHLLASLRQQVAREQR